MDDWKKTPAGKWIIENGKPIPFHTLKDLPNDLDVAIYFRDDVEQIQWRCVLDDLPPWIQNPT